GLQLFVPQAHRLPSLTTVRVPEGVDDARVRGALLAEHSIDIGGGQGPLAGKVWRIGLMGYGSSPENLLSLLAALGRLLAREGFKGDVRDGVAAAAEALAQPGPD
ncbi:MAG TPA: alanine--glyoxylate aminotransferase family protein, partial [Dehalococcoidia bacterium]|nr:alanine--glyoxylate aminotransferase family protein [Dehalococcoidia bacterium]